MNGGHTKGPLGSTHGQQSTRGKRKLRDPEAHRAEVKKLLDNVALAQIGANDTPKSSGLDLRFIAFNMYREGYTKGAISRALGKSYTTINNWVNAALSGLPTETIEQMRALEGARLDHYLTKLESRIDRGDEKAINAAVRISERRSAMFGLNKPVRVDIGGDGLTEQDKEMQSLYAEAQARVALEEQRLRQQAENRVIEGTATVVDQ